MEKPEDYENTGSVTPSDIRFPFQTTQPVRDILFEIIKRHPRGKDGLSEDELVKLLYLVDWKHTIEYGKQATDIQWYNGNKGPEIASLLDTSNDGSSSGSNNE